MHAWVISQYKIRSNSWLISDNSLYKQTYIILWLYYYLNDMYSCCLNVFIKLFFFFKCCYNIYLPWLNSNMALVLLKFQLLLNMHHPSPWQFVIFYKSNLIRRPLQHPDRTEIKWKRTLYNIIEAVLISNYKITERGKSNTSNNQINDRATSWLGRGTSLKFGDIKIILWAQTSLSERNTWKKWHYKCL